jgi:hypothetical protein
MNSEVNVEVGDYIRWTTGVSVYVAGPDSDGVTPHEKIYTYGIVVEVAEKGVDIGSDIVIASSNDGWFVSAIDDPEYEITIISKGKHHEG